MKSIDCLFIGHNEMDFAQYEAGIRKMGSNSGAYRDLNLNFIRYNGIPYPAADIFNLFYSPVPYKPLNMYTGVSSAIAYLGTYLDARGLTFDYVNSFRDEQDELSRKLMEEDILTIAIITTFYISVFPILEVIEFIKRYNQKAKIILGGPYVAAQVGTQDPRSLDYLFGSVIGADIYVDSSQGEATLVKLIYSLKNKSPLEAVNNIYYKTAGGYAATPLEKEDNRLAENMVKWHLFADRLGEHAAVRTSISCPFSCAFCNFPEYAGKYQPVEAAVVERELEQLDSLKTVKSIHFIDDTFNVPVKRFKEILRMMIKNRNSFRWHSYFRCQYADKEMVELMKESGCEGVYLGLESGSNQILTNMKKAVTVEEYVRGIELLNRYGIVTHGNFILGFPGETQQTVEKTIHFIESSGIDFFRVQMWYCQHYTPIWRQRKTYNINGESFAWSHATMESKTACDLIDQLFLTIKNPTWMPQYNFDVVNFWHMIYRGIDLKQVKDFLKAFNNGIKEKLMGGSDTGAGPEVIRQLKEALNGKNCISIQVE